MKTAALSWPQFNPVTVRRVTDILRSGRVNYWTGGEGAAFEKAFADWLGARAAVSVSSGTAALHLALESLGVGEGDDVVCTPYSFIASSTCAFNAGARPVYADVGPEHLLTAETIERALTPRTKAVVVVHLFGQVADMGPILSLARRRGLFVVEDCAQCLGGRYRGRPVGTLGDVGCFSFCQSKHITTGGEGGLVVARSKRVLSAVRSLRDHGWKVGSQPKVFERVGYNFRMTEIQSVIGRGELERLDSWNLPRRKRLAAALVRGLRASPYAAELVNGWPVDTPEREASFWLVPFALDERKLKVPVAAFAEALQARGAGAYRILWPAPCRCAAADALRRRTVGFWVHPTRTLKEIANDVSAFDAVARKFSKLPSSGSGRGGKDPR